MVEDMVNKGRKEGRKDGRPTKKEGRQGRRKVA
jgi:hypothetical protein